MYCYNQDKPIDVKTIWHCLHADIVQLFSWFESIKMSGIKETANEPNIKENSNQMYLDCLPMLCHFYLKTSVHESINDIYPYFQTKTQSNC